MVIRGTSQQPTNPYLSPKVQRTATEVPHVRRTRDGAEAHRIGLVSEVAPTGELTARALEFARMMAEVPDGSRAQMKQIFIENAGRGFEESYELEHVQRMRRRRPEKE